jgi:hypothetical protein
MPKQPSVQAHRSFLLRCWQALTLDDLETMHWHFSLREVAETPQEQSFSTLGQLLDFLMAKLGGRGERIKQREQYSAIQRLIEML